MISQKNDFTDRRTLLMEYTDPLRRAAEDNFGHLPSPRWHESMRATRLRRMKEFDPDRTESLLRLGARIPPRNHLLRAGDTRGLYSSPPLEAAESRYYKRHAVRLREKEGAGESSNG